MRHVIYIITGITISSLLGAYVWRSSTDQSMTSQISVENAIPPTSSVASSPAVASTSVISNTSRVGKGVSILIGEGDPRFQSNSSTSATSKVAIPPIPTSSNQLDDAWFARYSSLADQHLDFISNHVFKPGEPFTMLVTSDGGHVAALVSQRTKRPIDVLVTIGAPILSRYKYNEDMIKRHINVYVTSDFPTPSKYTGRPGPLPGAENVDLTEAVRAGLYDSDDEFYNSSELRGRFAQMLDDMEPK